MSPKYRVTERDRWTMRHPRLSDHALERWDERAPDDARAPEFGYLFSIGVKELLGARHFHDSSKDKDATLIRVYHGQTRSGEQYGMVFVGHEIADDDVIITTVYRIQNTHSGPLRSYFWALSHENGGIVDEAIAPDMFEDGIPKRHPQRGPFSTTAETGDEQEVVA